jgi:hypothetical protein
VLAAGLEVPTGYRAQGVPARIVRSDKPGAEYIARGAADYAAMAARYAAAGIGATGDDLVALLDSAPLGK